MRGMPRAVASSYTLGLHEIGDGLYAYLQPDMPASAALELVEPISEHGRHGAFFARWGVGPHAIRIGVNGLGAKADDLNGRGTPFTEADTPAGDPVLVVEGETLAGAIIELVDDGAFVDA